MLRMNGSALGESGAPDTRRELRTGFCARLRGQRDAETGERAVPGLTKDGDAQSVFRVCEGPEADAHARSEEWRVDQ